jgi:hypothetical protein
MDRHPVLVHIPSHPPLAWRSLPPGWGVGAGQRAGSPEWIPRTAVAIARGDHGDTWTLNWITERFCELRGAGPGAAPTVHLVALARDDHEPGLAAEREDFLVQEQMFARPGRVYFGRGDCLYQFQPGCQAAEPVFLPGRIHSLAGSHRHTRPRLAVGLEMGAVLCFEDRSPHETVRFAINVERPVCGYTWNGSIIAAGEGCCELHRTAGRQVIFCCELAGTGPAPIAVLTARPGNRFGLVSADGVIRVYEMTR